MLDPTIFRAYDIRGIVDKGLTADIVCDLGKAIASLALEKGETSLIVGRDGRLSGPTLSAALQKGILSTGCNIIDIGMVPTPLVYYATHILNSRSGVMLTGSHNPGEYNGLKMVIASKPLSEQQIQSLYQRVMNKDFISGQGILEKIDIVDRYLSRITDAITLKRPLTIAIDCGNGITGNIAPQLFKKMGCHVHELFCEVDGRFPNHHPDPSEAKNLQDLMTLVKEKKADIGLAFDGDGDRLGVVTTNGTIIWSDRLLMLFAKSILKSQPNAKIIYDIKCSNYLAKVIKEHGGEPIIWKTGHSLIKAKLIETKAALAGEMSGHIFFNDDWYGFDDSLYAAARLLKILAESTGNSDALFSDIPDGVNTPELKILVSDQEKFGLMEQLVATANYGNAEIMTIDGLRVNFTDGWGLVRPSNTTPCLVLRFEAEDNSGLTRIKNLFREHLLMVKPDWVLPF